jgi:hypothetical protein
VEGNLVEYFLVHPEVGMNSTIKTIVALVTIIGSVFTGYIFLDARFAKATDVKAVERRLDYKIEKDYLIGMRDQLYQLKQQYPTPVGRTPVVDKEINDLETTIPLQQDKVKKLEGQ